MKNKMGLLVSTLALSISAGVSAGTDKPWNYMLGEQNPYPTPTTNEHLISPDGYDFVSMSLFTRHGSRYALDYNLVPSRLAEIKEVAKKGKVTPTGQALMKDVEAFSDWWEKNSDRLGGSTDIGFDELSELGQRSVQMVNVKSGKELGVPMGETIRIRSKSSGAQRTLESEGAFLGGAMIQAAKLQNPITVDNQNNLLNRSIADPQHYYGYHWGARVPLTKLAEQKIQAMLSDVPDSVISFSSGLIEGLSKDDASKFTAALFKLCQQDAPQGMRQGMCKPFENWYETGNDPSLMDYYFEINQVDKYYNFGPSVESKGLARQMGMPIIQDFIRSTQASVDNSDNAPHINVTFGHDAGVIGLSSALDLMVTTGTNEERMATFMPYKDFPMGANIAWQLFKNSDDKYAVRMLHNERIVNFQIDGCMDTELCEWDKVNEFYAQPEYSVMPERVPEPGKEKETKKEELVTNF